MAKFTTKPGVVLEAHVVRDAEAPLNAKTVGGNEQLDAGDALVTVKGKSYRLPALVFKALFVAEASAEERTASKGGQQKSETKAPEAFDTSPSMPLLAVRSERERDV